MTFEMESNKHEINMTYDSIHGLEIIGLKCPHEKKVEAIATEIKTWEKRGRLGKGTTLHLIMKILDGSYFKENEE